MTLGQDLDPGLRELRAEAESRMTQTWRVGTLANTGTDPDTLEPAATFTPVYTGVGRLKSIAATAVSERTPADQAVAVQTLQLHLPSGTTGITPDMRAVCTACPEDAGLVGRVVRIMGRPTAGQTTAARFSVEETGEEIPEGS